MSKLIIEWKHYDKKGETCTRCNSTGENIKETIAELKGVQIDYVETMLDAKDMAQSNSVLINGVLIEEILGLRASHNHCGSCSCLAGTDTDCKTVEDKDTIYEAIPKEILLAAINQAIGK